MTKFHHQKLPVYSTLLAGREPPDGLGFRSDKLQIWYNNISEAWKDDRLHKHLESDECFIVLKGALIVELENNQRVRIEAGEFCCFPVGVYHTVVEVETPAKTLMIRAPSVNDKVYLP
jgi:mannose-6-phosphate isomerase-like protein (cupin superfamily)